MIKALVCGAVLLISGPALAEAPAAPNTSALPRAEDARLAAFFEQALQEELALSPQRLAWRGKKDRYGELNDYRDTAEVRFMDLKEAQLRKIKREFSREN